MGRTKWQITYDLREKVMIFNTSENKSLKRIDLQRIDFSCSGPLRLMSINTALEGDVTDRFEVFDPKAYDEFLAQLKARTAGFPERVLEAMRAYPPGLNRCGK